MFVGTPRLTPERLRAVAESTGVHLFTKANAPVWAAEDRIMSIKLLVLYPTPTDAELFDRRYQQEHLPMGKANLIGATGLASHRIVGSPTGNSPLCW